MPELPESFQLADADSLDARITELQVQISQARLMLNRLMDLQAEVSATLSGLTTERRGLMALRQAADTSASTDQPEP